MWRVKTLTHQLKAIRKRRRLTEGVDLVQAEEHEDEEPRRHTARCALGCQ